ncbi:MAG: hypothetical protein AAB931_00150 [Patescibacteria group bacterium]
MNYERARKISEIFTNLDAKEAGIRFLTSGVASAAIDLVSWRTSHSVRELIIIGLIGFEPLRHFLEFIYLNSRDNPQLPTPRKSLIEQLEENIFESPRR